MDKFLSIRMKDSDVVKIDRARAEAQKLLGVPISRNAFLKKIIFENLDYPITRVFGDPQK